MEVANFARIECLPSSHEMFRFMLFPHAFQLPWPCEEQHHHKNGALLVFGQLLRRNTVDRKGKIQKKEPGAAQPIRRGFLQTQGGFGRSARALEGKQAHQIKIL